MLKNFTIAALLLGLAAACVSPFEYVDNEVLETRQQLHEDLATAESALLEGDITKDEYDVLVDQAKAIAEARLQQLPGEVKVIVEQNKEKLQERGKGFLLSLTDILLMVALGGGAGASGLAVRRRQQLQHQQK